MGNETKVPLLEKVYFENCPGCRLDQRKEENSGIPYKEFFYVWIITLSAGLPISALFPFLYFMIRDLNIAKRVEDIGFYAGFVGGAFMLGRALTSVFWGLVADRWGRKPVIVIGLISVIIFNTLFGLSVNYWMAIAMRYSWSYERFTWPNKGVCCGGLSTRASINRTITATKEMELEELLLAKNSTCELHVNAQRKFSRRLKLLRNSRNKVQSMSVLDSLNVKGGASTIEDQGSCQCQVENGKDKVSTSWAISLVIGPALGGFFAQPAEKFPDIFSEESFLGRFPYFLPCVCISVFAAGVLVTCFWLPETLHNHPENITKNGTTESLEVSSHGSVIREKDEEAEGRVPPHKENLLRNWPLMSSIIVYCVFSLHDMAYTEIFSLWAESDRKFGGLSFSSKDVGEVFSITGTSLLVFQLFFYPRTERLLGPINLARLAAVLSIPLLASYPFMNRLSGPVLSIVVNSASVLKNIFAMVIITGTFILQNNAVSQHQRGAANGISMAAMSIFKAVAPAAAGVIFSWAQRRQHASFFPGDEMVFFILILVEFLGLLMTFKPFLVTKNLSTNISTHIR